VQIDAVYTSVINSVPVSRAEDIILLGSIIAEPDLVNGIQPFKVTLKAFGAEIEESLVERGQRDPLSLRQRDALASQLTAIEQRTVHIIRESLPDCVKLADQLHALFANLGWPVPVIPGDKFYEPVMPGIRIRSRPDDKTAVEVRRILSEVLGFSIGEVIERTQNMDWFEIEIGRMPL
jgi:hypothetical protein